MSVCVSEGVSEWMSQCMTTEKYLLTASVTVAIPWLCVRPESAGCLTVGGG